MLDLLTQFPIVNENASMVDLQEEALAETRSMALAHGYGIVGPPSFQVRELPLGMYLECRLMVQELDFGGGRRGK